jgi:ABC-2 type transport system permease protein
MSFILIGTILSNYIAAVFWGMGFSLKTEMDSGVLESNWMTPVPRPLFLAGQTVSGLLITTFNSAGMLAIGSIVFGFSINGNLLQAALILVPMLVALYGFGFAFAAVVLLMKEANTLIDITNYVVSMLSGAQFPVQVLPRVLLPLSLALPLTYGFDAIRGMLLGTTTLLPLPYEIAVLVVFMALMVVVGSFVFRRIERRVRVLGTLGTH